MKKTISLFLVFILLVGLAACGSFHSPAGGAVVENPASTGDNPASAGDLTTPAGDGTPPAEDTKKPERERPSAPDDTRTPAEEIVVSDLEGFIKAIAPGATIVLQGGGVTIPGHPFREETKSLPDDYGNPYVSWTYEYDGYGLTVTGVTGLTIKGGRSRRSPFINTSTMTEVLGFEDCADIVIENISAGHSPRLEDGDGCVQVVFLFENCQNITIRNTGMYGCGTHGLWLYRVGGMVVEDSEIYECSQGLFAAYIAVDVTFRNTIFRDTFSYDGEYISLSDSENILFENCVFRDNYIGGSSYWMDYSAFFSLSTSQDVVVRECDFINNESHALSYAAFGATPAQFEFCSFSGNDFENNGKVQDGVWIPKEGVFDTYTLPEGFADGDANEDSDEDYGIDFVFEEGLIDFLIDNVDKAYDMVYTYGMATLVEPGETIDLDGLVCYLVSLGTNHDDVFVKEIHYAISLTGNIYEYDGLEDCWYLVSNAID
jgi:hypothetical protein